MGSLSQTETKETRINIRASQHQKEVITRAAKLRHTTVSDFVLEKAFDAANEILANEMHITMPRDKFEEFCRILDNPPRKNVEAFTRMLEKPSVLA